MFIIIYHKMLSMMMQFEKDFEAEMRNHPGLSLKVRELHYWLAFFMTFINNWDLEWYYVFWTGTYYDVSFLLKFVEDTKDYNDLLNSKIHLATVDAHLYWFYRDNAAFTQTLEFKKFIEAVSEESFKKELSEVFPGPQQ